MRVDEQAQSLRSGRQPDPAQEPRFLGNKSAERSQQRSLPPAGEGATQTSPATLLQLIWLASPALPVGGFSYSEGLESAVDAGRVTNEREASAWLRDQLHLGLARCEMPVVARAVMAWQADDLAAANDLNRWFVQTRETHELRRQAEQMGRSMVEWLRNRTPDAPDPRVHGLASFLPAPTWPLAFALAAAQSGAAVGEALLAFGFGWAENMVQAAMKTVPLGQAAGQRVLAGLAHDLPGEVARSIALADTERQAFTPMLAVLSSRHEVQYSRLFRS